MTQAGRGDEVKMRKTNEISLCAIGIALYVAFSFSMKIPVVGHASLDLGYVVLAVYCYYYGSVMSMIIGGVGCMIMSLLTSGWFPPGWIACNVFIGWIVGMFGDDSGTPTYLRIVVVFFSVFLGVIAIKTPIECLLYSIPAYVKLPRSAVVFLIDAFVMILGTWIAPKIPIRSRIP